MDRLQAMQTFVAIVDGGSLTAAARSCGRSLPAVVRALAALESSLGVRLLRRTTRRMSLTPEGRDYLARCRQILAAVEDAEASVSRSQASPRGELRITAPVLFGHIHLTPCLTRVLERHPDLRVDLLLLDRNVDLIDEGIDLALRIGELADSGLVAHRLGTLRRIVCASPRALRDGTPQHPSELAERPCLRFTGLGAGNSWRFRSDGRALQVRVDGGFQCNQVQALAVACTQGRGFGQFLAYQVADQVASGELRVVLADYESEPLPVSLVYPGGRLLTSRLKVVLDALRPLLSARLVAVEAALSTGAG